MRPTKGAIVTFTKALAQEAIKKGIRVNAVAPGPVWTSVDSDVIRA
jgi:NAD(P)-dependent dehydrogenase (short-subunit alcohol dehydrogenase family)